MTEPLTLVLLAAGHGRRFGGDKQLEGFGPAGELLLEYDLYDAHRAGFDRAVLVVRAEIEDVFRERLDAGAGRAMEIDYVHQAEPRGTGHALLMARDAVPGPFAVANADDVYGPASFAVLANELARPGDSWAMVGYELARTLSPSGPVSRALCRTDAEGRLTGLVEMPEVETGTADGAALVSMNLWGLRPDVFDSLDRAWAAHGEGELMLPAVIGDRIAAGEALVDVLGTDEAWLGVTWADDRARVHERLAELVATGRYPSPLWEAR